MKRRIIPLTLMAGLLVVLILGSSVLFTAAQEDQLAPDGLPRETYYAPFPVPITLDSPTSPAAVAIRDIARRLTGETVPIQDVAPQRGGIMQRIARMFGRSG